MQTQITKSEINTKLREAQNAMWALEDIVFSRSEILKITGILQGKKFSLEEIEAEGN